MLDWRYIAGGLVTATVLALLAWAIRVYNSLINQANTNDNVDKAIKHLELEMSKGQEDVSKHILEAQGRMHDAFRIELNKEVTGIRDLLDTKVVGPLIRLEERAALQWKTVDNTLTELRSSLNQAMGIVSSWDRRIQDLENTVRQLVQVKAGG